MEAVVTRFDWLMSIDWAHGSVGDRMTGIVAIIFVLGSAFFTIKFIGQCIMLRKFSGPLAVPLIGNCYVKEAMFLMKYLEVIIKGPGSGRESAIRALGTTGLNITVIKDITPIPHNGCRPPKRRRV